MQMQQKSQHLKIITNIPIEFSIVCFKQLFLDTFIAFFLFVLSKREELMNICSHYEVILL